MHPRATRSLAYRASLQQIATALHVLQHRHIVQLRHRAHGQLPVCREPARPTICTLTSIELSRDFIRGILILFVYVLLTVFLAQPSA